MPWVESYLKRYAACAKECRAHDESRRVRVYRSELPIRRFTPNLLPLLKSVRPRAAAYILHVAEGVVDRLDRHLIGTLARGAAHKAANAAEARDTHVGRHFARVVEWTVCPAGTPKAQNEQGARPRYPDAWARRACVARGVRAADAG